MLYQEIENWGMWLNSSVLAQHVQGPEFNPQHQRERKKTEEKKRRGGQGVGNKRKVDIFCDLKNVRK